MHNTLYITKSDLYRCYFSPILAVAEKAKEASRELDDAIYRQQMDYEDYDDDKIRQATTKFRYAMEPLSFYIECGNYGFMLGLFRNEFVLRYNRSKQLQNKMRNNFGKHETLHF